MKKGVEDAGMDYKINEKDGAFYGPKIDVYVTDAFKRQIQCATVQVDFQLPSKDRFDLIYVAEDGSKKHPVIIHRAVLGSIERFIALITEHYGGKWFVKMFLFHFNLINFDLGHFGYLQDKPLSFPLDQVVMNTLKTLKGSCMMLDLKLKLKVILA